MNYIIRNMQNDNCKQLVKAQFEILDIRYASIDDGEVVVNGKIDGEKKNVLKAALTSSGYEFIDDKRLILTEKIKSIIIKLVHGSDEWPNTNFSNYLCDKIGYHYTYLANVFSAVQGITIARFIMTQKVEKIKKLIATKKYNLKEIASLMNYSSVAHLSTQFKKVTNISPSGFKNYQAMSLK